jgi:CARDB
MSCRRSLVMLVLISGLVAACGRSPVNLRDGFLAALDTIPPADSGPISDAVPDAAPMPDLMPPPDAPVGEGAPCLGTCIDICKMLVDTCNLYSKGPGNCLKECGASWKPNLKQCLALQACAPAGPDCKTAMACIASPPKVDLTVSDLKASSKSDMVTYSFKACNKGTSDSGTFSVDLYYDEKSAATLKTMGNQTQWLASLKGGACHSVTLTRNNTPLGIYDSWVRVDAKDSVVEIDETNNVAGPVNIKVITGPPKPDLMVKAFSAKVNGMDIDYEATICNMGTVNVLFFRADIYYKRSLAPSPYMVGDVSAYVVGLAPLACKTIKKTYKNVPVGLYNAWVQADTLNTVKESDETNNVAGPQMVLVSAPQGCTSLCTFASACGEFKLTEFNQCLTWCKSMNTTERACADAAAKATSCSKLKACSLPAKPPPPTPPWACLNICDYLIKTCKLVPANQNLTCIAGCVTLAGTKRQCAENAMKKKQCAAMMLCIL